MVNQLNSTNHEITKLRIENDKLKNDLREENETNERMMRSKESMNQLTKKTQSRLIGKIGLGQTDQGESSQQGAQKNKMPTCNNCGKIGHTSNKCWSNNVKPQAQWKSV